MTFEQEKTIKAWGVTLGVHLLLLLFFVLYKYSMPKANAEDIFGVEVNLGTSDDGSGDDQPEAMGMPANLASEAEVGEVGYTPSQLNKQKIQSQEDPLAAKVSISERTKQPIPRSHNVRQPNQRTQATSASSATPTKPQQAKYTYQNSQGDGTGNMAGQNNPGGSEGIGTGSGDMGAPGGTVGASNYAGTPGNGGTRMAFRLGDRKLISARNFTKKYREGGTVQANITVNRAGKVVDYRITSASNPEIRTIAESLIKNARFNQVSNAKPEEFGSITLTFKN